AEEGYAQYLLKEPILGYSAQDHIEQFRFIANRRAKQLKVAERFPGATNALPWLDEQASMRKEENFFETRVTEYQTGASLQWSALTPWRPSHRASKRPHLSALTPSSRLGGKGSAVPVLPGLAGIHRDNSMVAASMLTVKPKDQTIGIL